MSKYIILYADINGFRTFGKCRANFRINSLNSLQYDNFTRNRRIRNPFCAMTELEIKFRQISCLSAAYFFNTISKSRKINGRNRFIIRLFIIRYVIPVPIKIINRNNFYRNPSRAELLLKDMRSRGFPGARGTSKC